MLFDRLFGARNVTALGLWSFGLVLAACSGAGTSEGTTADSTSSGATTTSGSGGAGGASTVSSSSGFVTSSTSSTSTGTGAGGAPPTAGTPGSETVSAGQLSTSPSYRMVMTMGQPTQNQGLTTSPGYKLRGGLIPATQK